MNVFFSISEPFRFRNDVLSQLLITIYMLRRFPRRLSLKIGVFEEGNSVTFNRTHLIGT